MARSGLGVALWVVVLVVAATTTTAPDAIWRRVERFVKAQAQCAMRAAKSWTNWAANSWTNWTYLSLPKELENEKAAKMGGGEAYDRSARADYEAAKEKASQAAGDLGAQMRQSKN